MARPRDYPYGADIRSSHLSFAAGDPSLNFINTQEYRKASEPQEFLHCYADLLVFCERIRALPRRDLRDLRVAAERHPRKARSSFRRALGLREAMYRTLSSLARGARTVGSDLETIDSAWKEAMRRSRLVHTPAGVLRQWKPGVADLDAAWWTLVSANVSLLQSEDLSNLRECPGADCGWLFLDKSHSRRRVWCSMDTCGNREKAARHYAKKRQ